jgi:hypothetical protein
MSPEKFLLLSETTTADRFIFDSFPNGSGAPTDAFQQHPAQLSH